MDIDRIILGDNQFWGVNHASQDKGKETAKKFGNIEEVERMLLTALEHGVTGVMLSTHDRIYEITDMMRKDKRLKKEMAIYVNLPYIIKYIRMASEAGIVQSLKNTLGGQGVAGSMRFALRSARGVVTGDYLSLANRLIDIEMSPFHGLNVRAVFLHNALTDLALGYGMGTVLRNFYDYVESAYGAIPAFGTLNLVALDEFLSDIAMPKTLIMTAVNKNGFLMNPSKARCEETIANTGHTILAMGTLASGTLAPDEAYQYLGSLPRLQHVVVGVSTQQHAAETFKAVRKHLG